MVHLNVVFFQEDQMLHKKGMDVKVASEIMLELKYNTSLFWVMTSLAAI